MHQEPTASDQRDADLVTAMPADHAMISVMRPADNVLAELEFPVVDATNAKLVTSDSPNAPDATATATLTHVTRTPECAPTVPETLLETIANSARTVTTATHFWVVMTNANLACVPTDQAAADSSPMDANKMISWTALFATA